MQAVQCCTNTFVANCVYNHLSAHDLDCTDCTYTTYKNSLGVFLANGANNETNRLMIENKSTSENKENMY